ncbi:hypothetical protein ACFLTJ_00445 [Chloroflexota bacterium]
MFEWFRVILGGIIGALAVIIYYRIRDVDRKRHEKLRIHFTDLKELVDILIFQTQRFAIKKGRICFGGDSVVSIHNFEKGEYYQAFKAPFPEEAKAWEALKEGALEFNRNPKYKELPNIENKLQELKRVPVRQRQANWGEEYDKLSKTFRTLSREQNRDLEETQLAKQSREFSAHLSAKIISISKYGVGKDFKRVKRCSICHKF